MATDRETQAGAPVAPTDDEATLAKLGYKQELTRTWSGFTNFAISFTIISVLAGCFTNFGFAWNNGGPALIAWGWPILCGFVLLVAFSMSELTSAYPTAGGPYWWSAKLGGPAWSWFTGWFNIVGLVGVVAGVGYGCALFMNATFALYGVDIFGVNFGDDLHVLPETFLLFLFILAFYTVLNIFSAPLLALFNNISVGWHVVGVLAVIGLLVFVPDTHQSADFVFTERFNNSGFHDGATGGLFFWLYIAPLGFILTMYTQTGYDASAHTAEETRGASIAAAKGLWRAVFFSAVAGWFVLLAFLFAANDVAAVDDGAGFVGGIFTSALDSWAAKLVFIIATVGQLFCGMAGMTSASRTWYAFSRDRGMPGWQLFRRVNRHRVPVYAVLGVAAASLVITIPANWGDNNVPWAYVAITSICTIGLYIAYTIPVFLRLRAGDSFEPGPWNLGRKYKAVNIGALVFVALVIYSLDLPLVPAGLPWNDDFTVSAVNYSPLVLIVGLIVAIWWVIDAKNRYHGPVREIATDELGRVIEDEPEEPTTPPGAGPTGPTPAPAG